MRTIEWRGDHAVLVDQTVLPEEVAFLEVRDVDTMIDAIRRLAVRGAPAIGVAGAFAVALAAQQAERDGLGPDHVRAEAERVRGARPTAVNLAWAVDRVLARLADGVAALVAEAAAMAEEDVAANRRLGARGADLLEELGVVPARLHTHCNTGGLAAVEWGTALGIARELHDRGELVSVTLDETRPLLQGSRLTAFELDRLGIEHRVVVDGAGPSLIARGLVDAVVVGADRIAANGDVANKIGTYPLALAAARAGIPFVVGAPESTLDLATTTGSDIEIEERAEEEVLSFAGRRVAPAGSRALNPAFDVTPADLVTAVVTDQRVIRPASGERP
ncbi:MAG: S-methyl-5-thioribose-1-phosphate isomerase [Ilumatobacteraceae bacterium]